MGFWKNLKSKLKIGRGAVLVATLAAGSGWWGMQKYKYEDTVLVFDRPVGTIAWGGDGGIHTPQRDAVVESLSKRCPTTFVELGDLCYDVGCVNKELIQEHIVKPFGDLCPGHLTTFLVPGNHDSYASKQKERDFLAKTYFNGAPGKVVYHHYYYLAVFTDACLIFFDSTAYDVKAGEPDILDDQERDVEKYINDDRCKGKVLRVGTHANPYSKGSHGQTHSQRYLEWFHRVILPHAHTMNGGHSHSISEDASWHWRDSGLVMRTSGSLAKTKKCKDDFNCMAVPGYWWSAAYSKSEQIPITLLDAPNFIDTDED